MNEALLVECAKWLHNKREEHKAEGKELWWTPYVLTQYNPDRSSPNVNIDQAYEVFRELRRRRLIGHKIVSNNGTAFPAFLMLENKDEEWNKLMSKRRWMDLYFIPWGIWLAKNSWLLILFIGGILVTQALTIVVNREFDPQPKVQESRVQIDSPQLENLLLRLDALGEHIESLKPPESTTLPSKETNPDNEAVEKPSPEPIN